MKFMEMNKVSIITPMYNAQRYIAKTIESVQEQTYSDWEMIIVDDCSTDNSADIVQAYAKEDERICYIRLDKNEGVAYARNIAIQRANGRYLAFLDSDDIWNADKLRRQLVFMQEKKAVFCYTACNVIDANGEAIGKTRNVPSNVTYTELLKGNVIPCLTVLLDIKKLSEWGINISMPLIPHEDYAMWLSILKEGVVAEGMNEVLAEYRVGRSSISANKLKTMKWTFDIYWKYLKLGLGKSCRYFANYVLAAIRKRI